MKYAFLSYCSVNRKQADDLREILMRNGIPVKMAPYDMKENYPRAIKKAIVGCACVVLLLTKESAKRDNIIRETEIGLQKKKKPYVVVDTQGVDLDLPGYEDMEYYLGNQHIDRVFCYDKDSINANDPTLADVIKKVKGYTGVSDKKHTEREIPSDRNLRWHHILTKAVLFLLAAVILRDALVLFGGDQYGYGESLAYMLCPWLKWLDTAMGVAGLLWVAAILVARHRLARYRPNSSAQVCGVCLGSAATQVLYAVLRGQAFPLSEAAYAMLFGGVALVVIGVVLTAVYYYKRSILFR